MLLQAVDEHRAQINGITDLAGADIGSYATSIIDEAPDHVAAQLRTAVPAVIATYGDVAATAGALFYETNRPTPGFTAELATPIAQQVASELGWAFLPLFRPDQFDAGAAETVTRLGAVTQKFVASADRDTIRTAAASDRRSTGTHLFATAGACAFCAMMSAQSVRGGHWHDHCHCVEVPAWQDAPAPLSEVQDAHAAAFVAARKQIDAARAAHPDWQRMAPRHFLKKHPELVMSNKNLTRVMRADFGYTH